MLLAVALLAAPAAAGVIQSGTATVSGPGLGTAFVPAIITPNPNNDEVPSQSPDRGDGNLIVPIKRFDFTDTIDIQFQVNSSDGVTEYKVFESVDNNTGSAWSAYTVVLGFGTGANFLPSTPSDLLDFDAPEFNTLPTSAAFPTVTTGSDILIFSGGIHGSGAQIYQYRIDVPDGITSFTLRQIPTAVPEPSTLVLAGMGAISAVVVAVRRRRRS